MRCYGRLLSQKGAASHRYSRAAAAPLPPRCASALHARRPVIAHRRLSCCRALTSLSRCGLAQELFFYGAGYGDYFRVGMAALHGPELPLELFGSEERRPHSMKGRDWDYYRVRRMEEFCTNSRFTHLPDGRMHPSCCVATASWPKRWGYRWHETLRIRFSKSTSMWMQTAMPYARQTTSRATRAPIPTTCSPARPRAPLIVHACPRCA